MSRIDSSDPLPFTKVDRAVKAKAAVLASTLGISNQHALGSLIEFWDLNGDPREIERLLDAGESTVVLNAEEVSLRFKIASGKDIDPRLLARAGFLEPIDELYRVRGMSRYFEPVEKRRQARAAASVGGKVSAQVRKAKTGSAQPKRSFEPPFEGRSSDSQAESEPPPKRSRSDARSDFEAEPEAPPNLEDRGQSLDLLKDVAGFHPPPPEIDSREPGEHQRVIAECCRLYEQHLRAPYGFRARDAKHVQELRELAAEPEEIFARWELALRKRDKWPKVMTLGGLVQHWNEFPVAKGIQQERRL